MPTAMEVLLLTIIICHGKAWSSRCCTMAQKTESHPTTGLLPLDPNHFFPLPFSNTVNELSNTAAQ